MNFYTSVIVHGNNILYRGVENGKRVRRKVEYKPTFYLPSKDKSSKFKTLYDEPVEEFLPGTIKDARESIEQYKDVDGFTLYGMPKFDYAFISDNFSGPIEWSIDKMIIGNIDIEVGEADGGGYALPEKPTGEVTAITLKLNDTFHVFGCGEYKPDAANVIYTNCRDEKELLTKFLHLWVHNYPDVVTGWNCKFYDFPYLINRIARILGADEANSMSPWGLIKERVVAIMGKDQKAYEMLGIVIYDYMELFRKFAPNGASQESYRLDHIANVEIGERKLSYDEYDSLFDLHKHDFQKFMGYNLRDVYLVDKIDYKLKLINLALTAAYDSKVNYGDVFHQTRMWTSIIYNHLREKDIVVLYNNENTKDEAYEGAYVKEPIIGMHENVASFDLTSLYPSLILMYNISPETFAGICDKFVLKDLIAKAVDLGYLKTKNLTVCPNGALFRRDKLGFLSEIIDGMFNTRQKAKKLMLQYSKEKEVCTDDARKKELTNLISQYDNIQNTKKISLNSCYGALGNKFFFLFDVRLAEAITLSGQLAINWVNVRINEYMNNLLKTSDKDYVIASDTDSIYLSLDGIVKSVFKTPEELKDVPRIIKFMDKLCQSEIQPQIDRMYVELAEYVNAYAQRMIMKREVLADKAIWTAAKHYILNVHNSEGVQYAQPKLKIKGLEAIKSSTPAACRVKLKDAMNVIMTGDEDAMITFIDTFKTEFKKLPIEEVAFPRGVNGIKLYADKDTVYIKGSPMHVKGSLIYNKYIRDKELTRKYALIGESEKIKFIHMKEPNPFQSPVLAFPLRLPAELDAEKWIDYEVQFTKSFVDPLRSILDAIGWSTERRNCLF